MSFCLKGLGVQLSSMSVQVFVDASEVLIRLANSLDWQHMAELAIVGDK